jgi:hypothetical protein
VRDNARASRVFSFGIGNSVNRFLLEEMARAGRGVCEIVTLSDDADPVIDRLVRRIDAPVLTDIELTIDPALGIHDVLPGGEHLPDLFDAEPIVLMGRFDRAASGEIVVRGRTAAGAWERRVRVELPAEEAKHDVVKSLWARAKVDDLLLPRIGEVEQGTLDARTKAAVIRLGEAYSIATPYTSFVAVEKSRVTVGGKSMLVSVPVELPDGTNWAGFFGEGGLEALPLQVRDGGVGGVDVNGASSSAVVEFLQRFPAKAVDRGLLDESAGVALSDSIELYFGVDPSSNDGDGTVDALSRARREPSGAIAGKRLGAQPLVGAADSKVTPSSGPVVTGAPASEATTAPPPPPAMNVPATITASPSPADVQVGAPMAVSGSESSANSRAPATRPGSSSERLRQRDVVDGSAREQRQGQTASDLRDAIGRKSVARSTEASQRGDGVGLSGGFGGGGLAGSSGGRAVGGLTGTYGRVAGEPASTKQLEQRKLAELEKKGESFSKSKADSKSGAGEGRSAEAADAAKEASVDPVSKGASSSATSALNESESGTVAPADTLPRLTESERDTLVRVLDRRLLVLALASLIGDDAQIPALAKELGCGDGAVFEVAMKVALDANGAIDPRVLESLRALGVAIEDEVGARGLVIARVPPQALVKAALVAGVKRVEPVTRGE